MKPSSSMARRLCSRKFSSIMKNDFTPSLRFHLRHDAVQFLAGVVEIQVLALAAEKRRRGAEIAAHGAAHRRNDGRRRIALVARQRHAHGAPAEPGNDLRMANRRAVVFAQVTPHPGNAVAAHDVVGVDHVFDPRDRRHVPAHHDRGVRRDAPHHAAHLAHLADVDDDRGDAHDIVMVAPAVPPRKPRASGNRAPWWARRCSAGSSGCPTSGGTCAAKTALARGSPGCDTAPSG